MNGIMLYKAKLGFLQLRTAKALTNKLQGEGIVKTAKVYLPGVGINTFVENCSEKGKIIVERYFKNWTPNKIEWKEENE